MAKRKRVSRRSYRPRVYFSRDQKNRKKPGRSNWESNLALALSEKYYVKTNDRAILRPLEIDIVLFAQRGEPHLIEINGPVHYTPSVYGERAHKRSHRNDMRKLRKAQNKNKRILVIPAQNRMPSIEEVQEAIQLLEWASGSFSMIFNKMGNITTPLS